MVIVEGIPFLLICCSHVLEIGRCNLGLPSLEPHAPICPFTKPFARLAFKMWARVKDLRHRVEQ